MKLFKIIFGFGLFSALLGWVMAAVNDCIPVLDDGDEISVKAGSNAITGKRFVVATGWTAGGGPLGLTGTPQGSGDGTDGNCATVDVPAAGVDCLGVSMYDFAANAFGGVFACKSTKVVPVTAGATVTAGSDVETDNQGRAINLASGKKVGYCIKGATVGNDAIIHLQ